jgi:hypothetical protein
MYFKSQIPPPSHLISSLFSFLINKPIIPISIFNDSSTVSRLPLKAYVLRNGLVIVDVEKYSHVENTSLASTSSYIAFTDQFLLTWVHIGQKYNASLCNKVSVGSLALRKCINIIHVYLCNVGLESVNRIEDFFIFLKECSFNLKVSKKWIKKRRFLGQTRAVTLRLKR